MPVKDETQIFLRSARNELERAIELGTVKVHKEAARLLRLHSSLASSPTNPERRRSKPGEPPYREFGTLVSRLQFETFERVRGRSREFLGRVGYATYKVATWLELGTNRSPTSGPRPFLRPAMDSQRNFIVREIRKAGARFRGGESIGR